MRVANVATALADYYQLIRGDCRYFFDPTIGPADLDVGLLFGSEPKMQAAIVDGKIRRLRQDRLGLPPISVSHHDRSTDRTPVRFNAFEQNLEPLIGSAGIIAQQRSRLIHVHDA